MLLDTDNVSLNSSPGIYTYCLTNMQKTLSHPVIGIDDKHEVYYAEHNGIFAVVSDVSIKEFNEDILEKKITDAVWLAPTAKRHEEIVEFIMMYTPAGKPSFKFHQSMQPSLFEKLYTPVVPLRFCTIYRNPDNLFQAIKPHRDKIMQFLDHTAHKAEWSIKVFHDKTVFMKSYSDKERGLFHVAEQKTTLLPGENYLMTKKKQRLHEEMCKADIRKIPEDIYNTLSQHADRFQSLRCTRRDVHGKLHDMIMNSAFLIEWGALNLFQNTVNMLAERYRDSGIIFEFSGPWPPYNFCPILQPGSK